MPLPKPRVCLDSTLFTALFLRATERGEDWRLVRDILVDAHAGRIEAIVSTLVLVECDGQPALPPNEVAGGVDPVTEFFESDYLTRCSVDPLVAETARRLRGQFEGNAVLPASSWLWLATAQLMDAAHFFTYDRKLWKLNGQPALGALQITPPGRPWDAPQLSLADLEGVMPSAEKPGPKRSVVI